MASFGTLLCCNKTAMSEIRALTSLRFLAAFYVFVFHVHIRWPLATNVKIANFVSQGAVGMTVFFMLSGYILAHRYQGEHVDWRDYFSNRLARIYPVYLAAALATIPWMGLPPHNLAVPGDESLQFGRWIMLVLADVTAMQAWFPPLLKYWNNGASWSISAEAFFYAVFPIIVPLIARGSQCAKIRWLVAAYIFSFLPALGYILFDPIGLSAVYYSVPLFRLPEFVAGIALFHLCHSITLSTRKLEIAFVAVLGTWAWYLANFGPSLPLYVSHNWLNVPFLGMALLLLSRSDSLLSRALSISPAVWAGHASYCFYSFQVLVLFLAEAYRDSVIQRFPALGNNLWWGLLLFSALLVVSAVTHRFIEEPCRVLIRNRFAKRPSGQAATTAEMAGS